MDFHSVAMRDVVPFRDEDDADIRTQVLHFHVSRKYISVPGTCQLCVYQCN